MTHELKVLPVCYEAITKEGKNFEVCRMDRDFKAGDIVILNEYVAGQYTGRHVQKEITFVYKADGTYGLYKPYGIIGLKEVSNSGSFA